MFRYKQSALLNIYPIQYMYVFFQKWNCFGVVPFQDNMQFNSHSFDSISCQFIIPPQFTLKVENSRIIPIQTFQFQCPDVHACMYIYIHVCIYVNKDVYVCKYVCISVFLISSYGTPLAQRASYLALHSSLFGPMVQLITIILSLTALTLC